MTTMIYAPHRPDAEKLAEVKAEMARLGSRRGMGKEEPTLRQVNVRLSSIAERQLRDLAETSGESQSEIVRKAIAMLWAIENEASRATRR